MKNIRRFQKFFPNFKETVYIDEQATIIGNVILKDNVSIFPNAVLRGDINLIEINENTNVQDNSVLHVSNKKGLKIGSNTTIGHSVNLHACDIGSNTLIGIGSIILDCATIEDNCILGAGSLVPPNKVLKSGFLYFGNPAKVIRELSKEELEHIQENANNYIKIKNILKKERENEI